MSETTPELTKSVFTWWDQVPANLKTKTQLAKAGLKPAPAIWATIAYGRGRHARCYDLYDEAEAVPKKEATAAQLAALEKGRLTQRTCRRCGSVEGAVLTYSYSEKKLLGAVDGLCVSCNEADIEQWHLGHRDASIRWARERVAGANFLVLDSETTALSGELVEIAVLRPDGTTALDTLVKPSGPMGGTEIHGITEEMVLGAPPFADIEPVLRVLLAGIAKRKVIVYNASFDRGILSQEVWRRRQKQEKAGERVRLAQESWTDEANWIDAVDWECLMEAYAPYCGEWSERHDSYRWQPLGGGHRAMGDCRAALDLLRQMAETPLFTEAAEQKEMY